MSRTVAIIQARMGSTRLPGKILARIGAMTVLEHVIAAVRAIENLDDIVVATTTAPQDKAVLDLANRIGVYGFAGHEADVLDRYYQAALRHNAETIVRITADCPFLDPWVSSKVVARFRQGDVDYVSNCRPRSYPDGLDTEVFSFAALSEANMKGRLSSEREHVTPYIWNRPDRFRIASVVHPEDLSSMRWTVDEPKDLAFLLAVRDKLEGEPPYHMDQVLAVLAQLPELQKINEGFMWNEGYLRSLEKDRIVTGHKDSC
ncbi:MAG: acylneuraminate cytidylyltransferase [Nitrospira sp.]|nr:acylneuraminate cytidylyltransferase [Nitrospira sp.]